MQNDLINNTTYTQDAFSVWLDLKERFDRINGTKICYLHNDMYSLNQGALSVVDYYTNLRNIWEELSTMVPNLPVIEEVEEYAKYLQQRKLYKFLFGLNDSFSNVKSQILFMSPLPSIGQAYAMIIEEEQRHGNTSYQQTSSGSSSGIVE